MKIIVLGGGVVGVTTAYYLLKDGHEVTLIDRQPGVARECSHANGGFVAISQAVPWAAPGVPTKALREMLRPDAPILIHASQIPRMWRWGVEFMRAARAEPSWANTRHVLRLSLFSFEALKEIRADTNVDYDAVKGGALKLYSDQESLDEAVAVSERQRPLGLAFRVLDRKGCLDLVPALAPRIDALAGGLHFIDEEGGDCFKFTEGLAAWCRDRGAVLGLDTTVERLEADGARITGVRTDRGAFVADAYVLALGADSPLPMRPLGVRLPIIPVKGYSITVPRAPFPDAPTIPVVDEMRKFGMMPLPGPAAHVRARRDRRLRHGARGAPHAGVHRRLHGAVPAAAQVPGGGGRPAPILLPAAGHAAWAADPRPLALCQSILQRGPGPPRVDACPRLCEGGRGVGRRPRSRRRPDRPQTGAGPVAPRLTSFVRRTFS